MAVAAIMDIFALVACQRRSQAAMTGGRRLQDEPTTSIH